MDKRTNMNFFVRVTAFSIDGISTNKVLSEVFSALHLRFVDCNHKFGYNYAISFPKMTSAKMGDVIDIFSDSQEALTALDLQNVLKRLCDLVHIMRPHSVPKNIKGFAVFYRVYFKSARNRMIRYTKRHGESSNIKFKDDELPKLPFVNCFSKSTEQNFKISICRKDIDKLDMLDKFNGVCNSYGLSKKSEPNLGLALPVF